MACDAVREWVRRGVACRGFAAPARYTADWHSRSVARWRPAIHFHRNFSIFPIYIAINITYLRTNTSQYFNFNTRVMIVFTRKIRIWYFAIYFSMKISSYRIICDSLPCYSFSRDSPRTIRTTVIREIVDVNTLNIDIFIPRTAHLLKRYFYYFSQDCNHAYMHTLFATGKSV